jgi:hypothetical protein
MGIFSRSWEITKITFSVMKKERELFVFPILSVIFSFLFLLVILFPTVILSYFKGGTPEFTYITYAILFFVYLVIAFIATFFNVCVVYTVSLAFNGKPAKFWETIGYSFSKIHLIFMWSLVAATVGLILRLLDGLARKVKGVGGIILLITNSILGLAWAIATIFVIPGLVYHGLGPFAALKKSVLTLKKTWGESLVRVIGTGIITFLFIILGLIIGIPLIIGASMFIGIVGVVILVSLLFIYLLSVGLLFGVANQVFNTALYVYAETGVVPNGFNGEVLRSAFKSKKKLF